MPAAFWRRRRTMTCPCVWMAATPSRATLKRTLTLCQRSRLRRTAIHACGARSAPRSRASASGHGSSAPPCRHASAGGSGAQRSVRRLYSPMGTRKDGTSVSHSGRKSSPIGTSSSSTRAMSVRDSASAAEVAAAASAEGAASSGSGAAAVSTPLLSASSGPGASQVMPSHSTCGYKSSLLCSRGGGGGVIQPARHGAMNAVQNGTVRSPEALAYTARREKAASPYCAGSECAPVSMACDQSTQRCAYRSSHAGSAPGRRRSAGAP